MAKDRKLTRTFVDKSNKNMYIVLKSNIDDSYFLEVLYYYVRRALIRTDFNLEEISGIKFNGRFLGHELDVDFSVDYDTELKSLGLLMSIRAFMINQKYLDYCHNDEFLFYDLDSNFLMWNSHRAIIECLDDDDFRYIYNMILYLKENRELSDELIDVFREKTIRPEYKYFEFFCRLKASDPLYKGKTIIKHHAYLNADFQTFEVPECVDYIGDTAFAYCNNLETLVFTRKAQLGHFPIIECNNLKRIVVPTDLLDYYKEALPYYRNIITDKEIEIEDSNEEEKVYDLEIEHIYVGVPSADSYIETEVEADEAKKSTDYSIIRNVFDKKATSYKFFWFLAILKLYKEKGNDNINFKDILIKMVSSAWKYVFVEDSVFPKIDQIPITLSKVGEKCALSRSANEKDIEYSVIEYYNTLNLDSLLTPLLKNVPYRFLSPWIPFTDNADVVEKSNAPSTHCLYALIEDGIKINPLWSDYLLDNYDKLIQFVERELRSYIKLG